MTRHADNENFVRWIQGVVGVPVDGWAGKDTRAAVERALTTQAGTAPLTITVRTALEVVSHEAIVQEAYRDSVGVWTWGVGVTSASGHSVERYKDNPQTIQRCLEMFAWLLEEKYAPDVRKAFDGASLNEAQFAAALSFHYNTGAIRRASWVDSFKRGLVDKARAEFMEWRKPAEIIPRREKERDLFFDGVWSNDGRATVYDVAKPSYSPKWSSARKVDITADMERALHG